MLLERYRMSMLTPCYVEVMQLNLSEGKYGGILFPMGYSYVCVSLSMYYNSIAKYMWSASIRV